MAVRAGDRPPLIHFPTPTTIPSNHVFSSPALVQTALQQNADGSKEIALLREKLKAAEGRAEAAIEEKRMLQSEQESGTLKLIQESNDLLMQKVDSNLNLKVSDRHIATFAGTTQSSMPAQSIFSYV